jgi:hypothetical protein
MCDAIVAGNTPRTGQINLYQAEQQALAGGFADADKAIHSIRGRGF